MTRQLGPAIASRAACLFGPDHVAANRLQHTPLQTEFLVDCRDACIAAGCHWRGLSQKILDFPRISVRMSKTTV